MTGRPPRAAEWTHRTLFALALVGAVQSARWGAAEHGRMLDRIGRSGLDGGLGAASLIGALEMPILPLVLSAALATRSGAAVWLWVWFVWRASAPAAAGPAATQGAAMTLALASATIVVAAIGAATLIWLARAGALRAP